MVVASAAQSYAAQRVFIGTITPSGNTVVERVTLGIAREFPEVSMHFSRTPMFGARDPNPESYGMDGVMGAARLLAHAKPQVLVWNGSKGAGIGFHHDRTLAEAVATETGIRTTNSVLGLADLLARHGIRRLGLVTPYAIEGQQKTLACLEKEGFEVVAHAYADYSDNLSYASVPLDKISAMARQVAQARPQAILASCTNFPAAVMAAPLEAELGIPFYDTTALGVWHALRLAGVDTTPAAGRWGSLFLEGL